MPERPPSAGGVERRQNASAAKPSPIPACDRCRNFKKKCSRTFPTCSLCASAGIKCSFSTPASSSDAQVHHLRARIDWLTSYFNSTLPLGVPSIETIDTGADLAELVRWITTNKASDTHDVLLPRIPLKTHYSSLEPSVEPQCTSHSPPHQPASRKSPDTSRGPLQPVVDGGQNFPPKPAARRFVDAYFRNVHKAYPFADRNRVLAQLESLDDDHPLRPGVESTMLYLIMAIGCTTLQRAGQIPTGAVIKFKVAYATIVQECLCQESMESIQILLLLALYSLFDPIAPSGWSMVSVAARQAMMLGLTRRLPEGQIVSATEIELRHRLFWSVFVLDRMMATTLGLPIALRDENLDVPLPGLTVDEFASPDRSHFASALQTSRHVIKLRQIEGKIMDQIHLFKQSKITALSHTDRRSIVRGMRAEIENWYSNGCLVSPVEPDNIPIHNSITWLSARYYYLLVILYFPSHFNSSGSVVSGAELLRFAQKHVQSSSVLFEQRQLPLNRVTLFRIFPIGLLLIHGFVTYAADCTAFPASDELTVLINILEAFPDGWHAARRASVILREFLAIVEGAGHHHAMQFSGNTLEGSGHMAGSRESALDLVRPAMTSFTKLVQESLGWATCYIPLESIEERAGMRFGSFVSHSSISASGAGRGSMASIPPAAGSDDSEMNYTLSAESLEIEFL